MASDRWCTAFHEAGHALVAYHGAWPIRFVTIRRNPHFQPPALGHVCWDEGGTFDERWAGLIGVAGPLAESRYSGCPVRWEHFATDCGIAMRHILDSGPDDYRAAGDELEREAQAFLERHWCQVEAIAKALLRKTTLTGADVERAIKPAGRTPSE